MPQNRDLFVRAVRPEDRTQLTTTRTHAEQAGWRILDRPALDHHGRPLPPKPHVEHFGVVIPKPEAPVSADTEETE